MFAGHAGLDPLGRPVPRRAGTGPTTTWATPASRSIKALALSLLIFVVVDGNLFINGLRDLDARVLELRRAPRPTRAPCASRSTPTSGPGTRATPGPTASSTRRDDIVTLNDMRVPVGAPGAAAAGGHRRPPQLLPAQLPGQAGRGPGHDQPPLVPGQGDRRASTSPAPSTAASHHYKMRGQLTVLSPEDYAAWAGRGLGACRARAFDPDDKAAHWGWDWERAQ